MPAESMPDRYRRRRHHRVLIARWLTFFAEGGPAARSTIALHVGLSEGEVRDAVGGCPWFTADPPTVIALTWQGWDTARQSVQPLPRPPDPFGDGLRAACAAYYDAHPRPGDRLWQASETIVVRFAE